METKDINGREITSKVWKVYDSKEITLEDAKRMTNVHFPDHEIIDFQTDDYLHAGGGFRASWLSKTK